MFGPQVSVFHPEVPSGIAAVVDRMLDAFPATGIVWDELKSLDGEDHCQAAIDALGRPATSADLVSATVDCFSAMNRALKAQRPDLRISCFLYADMLQSTVEQVATMEGLDEFGCDGKCHRPGEVDVGEGGPDKCLLGGQDARFTAAAKANGMLPFTLLETQLLDALTLDLSLERLPEFLAEKEGHLAYYYYPYGMENPDHYMPEFGSRLAAWRRG
jgi:hypothetical protein